MKYASVLLTALLLAGCRVSASTELYVQEAREWISKKDFTQTLPLQIKAYVPGTATDCSDTYWPQIRPVVVKYFQNLKFVGCEIRQGAIENVMNLKAELNVVSQNQSNVAGLLAVSLSKREMNDGTQARNGIEVHLHANPNAAKQLAAELREVNMLIDLDFANVRMSVVINNDSRAGADVVARGVFVDNEPSSILGEYTKVARRQRIELRLSDVMTAWLLTKGSIVSTVIMDDATTQPSGK